MANGIYFRQAREQDLALGLQLLREAAIALQAKGLTQWQDWLCPDAAQVQWVETGFRDKEFYFVEEETAQVCGMFRLSETDLLYWGKRQDKANYLHSLVVRKTFSGNGLGQKILQAVERLLLEKGIAVLRLDCLASNSWLCAYYERQGFVPAGQKQLGGSVFNLYEKKLAIPAAADGYPAC